MIQKFGTLIGLDRCTCCLCSHGMQELAHGNYGENTGRKEKKKNLCVFHNFALYSLCVIIGLMKNLLCSSLVVTH